MESSFWRIVLFPVSLIYGMVVSLRNYLFDAGIFHSTEFKIPVICVGNISVGGTGKTPHTAYLVELLRENYKVAVLSRGYKRITRGFQIATLQSTVLDIGDEPRQIKQKYPGVVVAVEGNRVHGIRKLLEIEKDLNVIILDDGYQHRWVKPGLSVLLVDYNRIITKDFFLPSGRLRESSSGLKRAQVIIFTKCPETLKPIERRIAIKDLNPLPSQHIFFTRFVHGNFIPVFPEAAQEMTPAEMKNHDPAILLVTGIANPRMLKDYLLGIASRIVEKKYPDHHAFRASDVWKITEIWKKMEDTKKYIITTEKDAMRLQFFPDIDPSLKSILYFVPVSVHFLDEEESLFNKQILSYVGNNKPKRTLLKN